MSIPESFLVIVRCITFNHHAYIEDAMNGFCMQKTNFPYLCVILDDCSTDGEQEVIKNYIAEYFNLLSTEETDDYVLNLCQHKTNVNCYFAVFYLKYNHYSIKKSKLPYSSKWQDKCKYIALCEGDDYWIDEKKLQMQVDFLEKNEGYSACYSNVLVVNEFGKYSLQDQKQYPFYPEHTIWNNNPFYLGLISQTSTLCARKKVFDIALKCNEKGLNGDIKLSVIARAIGHIFYFVNFFSKYRRSYTNGSWTAMHCKEDMDLWYLKTRITLFNYSEQLGKFYSNRNEYLGNFIISKIVSSIRHPNKSNFKKVFAMLKQCDFKIKLVLFFLKKLYKRRINVCDEILEMRIYNS